MPIASVFWANHAGQDIHLIPGYVGPRLDHLLWATQTAGGPTVRADQLPAPARPTFVANFVAGASGTAGVAISANGEVTVTAPLPSPARLLDFVVTATITEGANVFWANKRFRIHAGIERIWLTPRTLTVRQNARNMRFTVLAEFDDGTYGDLTPWCPWDPPAAADRTYVHLSGDNHPAIAWSTAAAGTIGVDGVTGRLTGTAAAGDAPITAALLPLPPPANRIGEGMARAAPPWSDPVTLTPIDGRFEAIPTVPNVLILPDGFHGGRPGEPSEQARFEQLARQLVHRLHVRQRTRPYDLLKDRMNYFMAWIPSREPGISPLEQVRRFNIAGSQADAVEVDTAVGRAALSPRDVAGAWHVATPPTSPANEFLLNERDTAFHVTLGERPRVIRQSEIRWAAFHPSRFSEEDFDDFLRALRLNGTAVGTVWARGGKDERSILVLCRSARLGGAFSNRQTSGRYICMTLDRDPQHRIEDDPGGLGKDLLPDAIPDRVTINVLTTTAHELAHSFSLEDEYGGEYGGGGTLPANRAADVDGASNLASRTSLLTSGNLDADKIKWRWPRIRKAGVLTAQPLRLGGRFLIQLEPGHGGLVPVTRNGKQKMKRVPITEGDVVRFRRRPLLTAPTPSDRFIVVNAVLTNALLVEPLTTRPFDPATYPPGSVVISPPRQLPDPNPAGRVFGDDLQLIHGRVRARINDTRNPLNAHRDGAANRPCPGVVLPTPTGSTNWPDTDIPPNGRPNPPNPPIYSSWIVGVYESGLAFDCDVYRPTGVCLMRAFEYRDEPTSTQRTYQFCPVCRYVMVDAIDPTKHGDIDADYTPRYPT
jgi:hypothetical protein